MAGLYTAAVIVLGLTIYALVPALASLVTALANLVFGLFQLLHQLILLPVKLVLKGTCLTPVCACALSDRCEMPPSHYGNPSRDAPVPRVHLPRSQIAYVSAPSVFYSTNAHEFVLLIRLRRGPRTVHLLRPEHGRVLLGVAVCRGEAWVKSCGRATCTRSIPSTCNDLFAFLQTSHSPRVVSSSCRVHTQTQITHSQRSRRPRRYPPANIHHAKPLQYKIQKD